MYAVNVASVLKINYAILFRLSALRMATRALGAARGQGRRVHPNGPHLHKYFKQIIKALGHCLCFLPRRAPHIHAVATHQHRTRRRMGSHGRLQALGQLILFARVLNNGDF